MGIWFDFWHFQPPAQGYIKDQNQSYPLIISVSFQELSKFQLVIELTLSYAVSIMY